ncbi:MAG: hypothetical protein BWZ11_00822 [Bacteroidetes bacterium ADurb.BinA395]|jgi:hypothetical protein|nr:hypothetical protein [Paludibacteraceae bacterium]OPZ02536.1 MAG: hypothetical protein BWZ11_00822 [Bacteroidetes bacterium ADurb.BinA395]
MKSLKLLLIILFSVSTFSLYSQEHITFKGIPLKGTINSFAQELVKKGCTIKESKGNLIILKGEFVNETCEIILVGSKKTNTIWKVVAYLPEQTSWYSIKSDYNILKKQFQQKYGDGESYEFFSDPYYEGDGYEMQALRLEKCTYATYFKTETGTISLEISKFQQISISYEDKINVELKRKESDEIINDEI